MGSLIKKLLRIIAFVNFVISCRSVELPTKEESQKKIEFYSAKIDSLRKITGNLGNLPKKTASDFAIDLNIDVVNQIFQRLAYDRDDDISLKFLPTKSLFKEDKSILGIRYTNFINIDTGNILVNLKSLKFQQSFDKFFDAIIELEGKGQIFVSGKYVGVPISASPNVELYLYETIRFEISSTNTEIIMKPIPKTLKLKTKIKVKLVNWDLPYYQEIPIQVTDLLKPLRLPLGFSNEILLPRPSIKTPNKFEQSIYTLTFKDSKINIEKNRLLFESFIKFSSKE